MSDPGVQGDMTMRGYQVASQVAWADLDMTPRHNLRDAVNRVALTMPLDLKDVEVVRFQLASIACVVRGQRISVSPWVLEDPLEVYKVLLQATFLRSKQVERFHYLHEGGWFLVTQPLKPQHA